MRRKVSQLLMLAGLLIAALPLTAQHVNMDFNDKINFSKYRTYYWQKIDMPDDIWKERAREAIDAALASKGWMRVDADGDVALVAMGATQTKTELETFYDGMGGWGWYGWGGGVATTVPVQHTEGTLIVDMFDAESKQLIWRASATDSVGKDPEHNVKKLNKAVEKMFKKFPPQPGDKKRS